MSELVCVDISDFSQHMDHPWNDQDGQAMKFGYEGHNYRIKKPYAVKIWTTDCAVAVFKVDHTISGWPDNHLDVAVLYVPSTGEWLRAVAGDEDVAFSASRQSSEFPFPDPWEGADPQDTDVGNSLDLGDVITYVIDKLIGVFQGHQEGKRLLPEVARLGLSALRSSMRTATVPFPLILVVP